MTYLNVKKAKNTLEELVTDCLKNSEVFTISTKDGNVVLLNEKEYNNIIESLYLLGIKGVYDDVDKAVKTPTSNLSKKSPMD